MLPFQAAVPYSKKKKPLTPSHKSQPFFFFGFCPAIRSRLSLFSICQNNPFSSVISLHFLCTTELARNSHCIDAQVKRTAKKEGTHFFFFHRGFALRHTPVSLLAAMSAAAATPSSISSASPPALPAALDFPRVKLLAVGDVGVGKSCVIKRYCEGRFVTKYIPTIGIDFGVKKVDLSKTAVLQSSQRTVSSGCSTADSHSIPAAVRVNFWDSSGDDDYREIRNEFYDAAQGILLFYDVRSATSFDHLQTWWEELVTYCAGLAVSVATSSADGGAAEGKRASVAASTVTGSTAAGKAVGHNEGKAPIVVLCANKADDTVTSGAGSRTARMVSEEQGRAWSKEHGCAGYYETSASTAMNVKEAIEDLVTQVVARFM